MLEIKQSNHIRTKQAQTSNKESLLNIIDIYVSKVLILVTDHAYTSAVTNV